MFIFLLGIFLSTISFIYTSETLTKTIISSVSLGFEENKLKWAANDSGTTYIRQDFTDLKFLALRFTLGTIQRNFLLNTSFSYGTLGRGDLEQQTTLLTQNFSPKFESTTKGQTFKPQLEIGYYIHLTPDHLNKITLIPKLGYGANFFDYYVKNPDDDVPIYYNFEYSDLKAQKTLKQTWDGFLLGGTVNVVTYDGFGVKLTYFYHFENLTHKFRSRFVQTDTSNNEQSYVELKARKKTHHGFSHEASLDFSYKLLENLSLSALMQYQYLATNNDPITLEQNLVPLPSGISSTTQRGLTFSVDHEVFDIYFSANFSF